jgi:ATP adenylyltransferase
MQHLHAYWRMPYIEAPKPDGQKKNPFASIPDEADESRSGLLERGQHAYLVLNKFPYNAGHILVVPYEAVPELADLSPAARHEMMDLLLRAQEILTQALKPDGFNIGFNLGAGAGAGIPEHVHGHVVPRWHGDCNFMPVIGDTRVLPQSMEAMWHRLRQFCRCEPHNPRKS